MVNAYEERELYLLGEAKITIVTTRTKNGWTNWDIKKIGDGLRVAVYTNSSCFGVLLLNGHYKEKDLREFVPKNFQIKIKKYTGIKKLPFVPRWIH